MNKENARILNERKGVKTPEPKLKPCPFCGGEVRIFNGVVAGVTMIVCTKCRATVSFGGREQKDKTIKVWNRRANVNE